MTNPLGTEDRTDIAVFECIARHGIEAVTMDMVAKRAQCSRSAFYRQHASWKALVTRTHRRALRLMDWWVPSRGGERRFEFEWWWSTMLQFFASDWGRAFLAMRPHVAARAGMHEVEHSELQRMPGLAKWLDAPKPVVRAIWALLLSAACPTLDEEERTTLRELAWAMVAQRTADSDADDSDIRDFVALDSLM